ncbi:hypothetical protein LC653_34985 [Nostoc sp. CHAB 5784]|uniref:hypothetical protein n=1 Tax=Nostoc mirabile TaxID=2907820 RepID=UPI001E34AFE2|nr:hypothetical protein [Nostoc mirabile]MCC5668924.1 hypothetical protein [Nostoc mirabile CHAB5784]
MKKLKFVTAFHLGVAAFLAVCLVPVKTYAQETVRTIKQSQVSGSTAKLQKIKVWNGSGVSISFYEINEMVKRVWIDDPSQVLIDTDGCLEGIDQNCQNSSAGLLHLRRIKKVLVPGLPQTSATLLTVITQTASGDRKVYHFQVTPSNSRPEYSQVSIIPDKPSSLVTRPRLSPLVQTTRITKQIRAGMRVAINNGFLSSSDELHNRIEQFLTHFQGGEQMPLLVGLVPPILSGQCHSLLTMKKTQLFLVVLLASPIEWH